MVKLLDLVERDVLIRLQERFSALLGFNVAFADLNFNTVGYSPKTRAYIEGTTCAKLASTENGRGMCYDSDKEAGEIAIGKKKPVLYRCHSYCSNFVIPIKISDQVVGFLYSGQFFAREPGEKTDLEWKGVQAQRGILNHDWPLEKQKIKEEEEKAWRALVAEESFFHQTVTGEHGHVRGRFFHPKQGKPTDDDLRSIARDANLTTDFQIKEFVETFRNQSNTDIPNNRVKNAIEIIPAIRTLSEVANALSEEFTEEYALRTYFETCQQIRQTSSSVDWGHPFFRKKITSRLKELSDAVFQLMRKNGERSHNRGELVDSVDAIATTIYEMLFQIEVRHTQRDIRKNKYLFFDRKIPKDTIRQLQEGIGDTSPRERKERLKQKILEATQVRDGLLRERTLAGPVTWAIGIIGLVLTILFGLKSMGVI
jgi:ligand-binding sensor protein